MQIEAPASVSSITFRMRLDMEKFDEELQQVVENSALSFPVEVVAKIATTA